MNQKKIKNIFFIIFGLFVGFAISFYFLIGSQLTEKQSENTIVMPDADIVGAEITKDTVLEQRFTNNVDELSQIELVFTANWRKNIGTMTFEILFENNIIYTSSIDLLEIPEQHRVYIKPNDIDSKYKGKDLVLRIKTDSEIGESVSPMISINEKYGDLYINGELTEGNLCLATVGIDKIKAGEIYWVIMTVLGIILLLTLLISYKNYKKNKYNYIISMILAIERYKFLISQLVSRDFKTKYKRSVFGILWSFLNPLLTMIVQFLVFSTLFRVDTQNYPVYLISGVICFSFFNECTTMCLNSLSGNSTLITKVYIPKYIFPLAKAISTSVNLMISLVPLLLVTLITGMKLHISILLMFFFLFCLIVFSLGIGMILATLMVFFRDIQFIWSVMLTIWQYATPIFYPAEIIPLKYRFIVRFNPLYHFIGNARKCLIDGISPEPMSYVYCLLFAFGTLAIGSFVFKKCQDKFTLYL